MFVCVWWGERGGAFKSGAFKCVLGIQVLQCVGLGEMVSRVDSVETYHIYFIQ